MRDSFETPAKQKTNKHASKPLIAVVVLSAAVLLTGYKGCAALSDAKGEVSNLRRKEEAKIVNGELDYGFIVSVTVKNVGKAGVIEIKPWLSSSEGEWKRTQTLNFTAGESKDLTYFFHEPTINATNIEYGIDVLPDS